MRHRGRLRAAGHFAAAVAATTLVGTIVQTQINLYDIQQLGVDIPTAIRLRTTGEDLLGFSPTMAGLAAAALLPAMPCAVWLARRYRWVRGALFALGGWCALTIAFFIADAVAPMPTLVAATRSIVGAVAVAASGAAGGGLFYLLWSRAARRAAQQTCAPVATQGGTIDD